MSVNPSPRILITRLSHIGDCILTLPLLSALRRNFPQSHIAWAIEKPSDQLIADHPDLNQLITVTRGWLRNARAIWELRSTLRKSQFDVVFDPQSLTKSSALGWLSGAPLRIGMARPHGREAAPWLNNRRIQTNTTHLVDRSLDLLRGLDIRDTQVNFRLPIDKSALGFIRRMLAELGFSKFIAINPGGTWQSKQWEMDRFAAVALHARQHFGLRCIVPWSGQAEREMAERICQLSRGSAVVAPATNLRQLAALLSQAQMYIGGDTGPMHIAAALGTPCVGLFGPTRAIDSGPYGSGHVALQAWYQAGSSRERRNASNLAMRDITVEQVCAAVASIHRLSHIRKTAA